MPPSNSSASSSAPPASPLASDSRPRPPEWSTASTGSWEWRRSAWGQCGRWRCCSSRRRRTSLGSTGSRTTTSSGTSAWWRGALNEWEVFEVMGWGRSYMKLAYCLAVSTLVGGAVAMEVNSWVAFCRKAKEEKMKREGMVGGDYDSRRRSHDRIIITFERSCSL